MGTGESLENAIEAKRLLSHAFRSRISDGFGISDQPAGVLIRVVFGAGRGKSPAEHLALKLECGMSILHSGRPSRTVASGNWLVITPEIMAAEMLKHSEWEFDNCGKILGNFPGAVCGHALSEYLGFKRIRPTVSIPMATLLEHFPQLRPVEVAMAAAKKPTARKRPEKPPSRLTARQAGQASKLRAQGFTAAKIAKMYKVDTVDVYRALKQIRTPVGKKVR